MITYDDAEQALKLLQETDLEAARAKAHAEAMDDARKTVLAMTYNDLGSGSAADKLKQAEGSDAYREHMKKLTEYKIHWETLRNQRKTAELKIDMWRSVNSNQRKGNI